MAQKAEIARPIYTGLRVRDLDRSKRFYKALGFHQTRRGHSSLGLFAQLEHPEGGFTLELNWFRKGSRAWEPYRRGSELDHIAFWVDDVDDWVRRLLRVGGRIQMEPFDSGILIPPRPVFRGRAAYVADPDGIWIELMGPRRASSQAGRARVRHVPTRRE